MLPANFKVLAEYFLVPLLVLLISYAISGQFILKYSAGTDLFIFFFSADLGALMEFDDLHLRINPTFRHDYLFVFGVLLTLSVLFMIVSGRTQGKIEAWREEKHKKAASNPPPAPSASSAVKYPLVGVIGCWVAAIVLMGTQLFVFFGKG